MVSTQVQEGLSAGIPFSFTMLITDEMSLPGLTLITRRDKCGLEENYYAYKGDKEAFDTALANNRLLLSSGTREAQSDEKTTIYGETEPK